MTDTRRRTPLLLLAIVGLLLSMIAMPAAADHKESHAGNPGRQCDGFDTDAKQEITGNGTYTWSNVPDADGNLYTVVGTVTNDGKTITFAVYDADGDLVEGATLDFCLKGGTNDPTNIDGGTGGSLPNDQQLSNVVVYLVIPPPEDPDDPDEVPEGQWCSPGFWRNSMIQAEAAAAAAGDFEHALPGNWREILASPQTYGGQLFNQVGDALSERAGLEWTTVDGERPEDTCPFAADRSTNKRNR